MSAILVTGGAGFIGSHFVGYLLEQTDSRIICLDNFNGFYNPGIKRNNISNMLNNPRFHLVEGDIRNPDGLEEIFDTRSPETVVHFAARAGIRPSLEDPLLYQDVNIRGTLNLLECCRRFEVEDFLFASSSSVYGNNDKVPFSEKDRVDEPISPYAATKKSGELMCYNYHHLYDMNITCLRFFTVYGPRQRPEMAIHKFTRLIDKGEPIPVYGDGTSCRDYTYIFDIIDGVSKAFNRMEGFRIYNLGESKTVELNELIDTIGASLGCEVEKNNLPEQPGDMKKTFADISRARKELGYQPEVEIGEGVEKFVKWYKTNREILE